MNWILKFLSNSNFFHWTISDNGHKLTKIALKSILRGEAAILFNAFTVVRRVISLRSRSRNIGRHTGSSLWNKVRTLNIICLGSEKLLANQKLCYSLEVWFNTETRGFHEFKRILIQSWYFYKLCYVSMTLQCNVKMGPLWKTTIDLVFLVGYVDYSVLQRLKIR